MASEIVSQRLHPDTDALLHDERVIASNSTSEMLLMERGHPWKLPVHVVLKILQEVITVSKKIENTVQRFIGLYVHSSASKDVLCLLNEVLLPGTHAPNRSVTAVASLLKESSCR